MKRAGLPDALAAFGSGGGVAAAQCAIGQAKTPPKLPGVPPSAGEPVPVSTKTCRLIFLFPVVLKDGSEISGMVEQDGAAVFDTARIFDQPWTITENREGLLRAQLTQSYEGATLECTMEVNWTLPITHDQPLQLGIEQKTKRDGVVWRNGFSVLYLSYSGCVLPRGDETFSTRRFSILEPKRTTVRTDLGYRSDISILGTERLESSYSEAIPSVYVEVKGLCSPVQDMSFRCDYRLPG